MLIILFIKIRLYLMRKAALFLLLNRFYHFLNRKCSCFYCFLSFFVYHIKQNLINDNK